MRHWLRRQYRRFFPEPLPANGVIPTSVTLDYRSDAWDLERMVLDGVSNHLPTDSGGNDVRVEWLRNKEWQLAPLPPKGLVGAIRISDDGPGYDAGLLGLLLSTKKGTQAVGQFGEGLKLLSAAALREGYAVEFRSRDWAARPFAKRIVVDGKGVEQLCFAITRVPWAAGSSTTFVRPKSALVKEFRQLPRKMRQFAPVQTPLYELRCPAEHRGPSGAILEPDGAAALYVRGVIVRNAIGGRGGLEAIFSYDLETRDISPDRQLIDANTLRVSIGGLLLACEDAAVRDRVLAAGERRHRSVLEFECLDVSSVAFLGYVPALLHSARRGRWASSFTDRYGEDAFLASHDAAANEDARHMGYRVVALQDSLAGFLIGCGVQTTSDLILASRYEWLDTTDLTTQERAALEDIEILHADNALGPVPPLRVYSKVVCVRRDSRGREVVSEKEMPVLGTHFTREDGSTDIGIAREILADREKFVHTYVHEMIHERTKAKDYTREYARGAIDIIVERFLREHPRRDA